MPLVEQELLTLLEHLSSPPVLSRVRVTRSLVLCVCFEDRCLSFFTLFFCHCVVCSSLIYRFWLPLWYLQTLLILILFVWSAVYKFDFWKYIFVFAQPYQDPDDLCYPSSQTINFVEHWIIIVKLHLHSEYRK